jgi:hypothetical protein
MPSPRVSFISSNKESHPLLVRGTLASMATLMRVRVATEVTGMVGSQSSLGAAHAWI